MENLIFCAVYITWSTLFADKTSWRNTAEFQVKYRETL